MLRAGFLILWLCSLAFYAISYYCLSRFLRRKSTVSPDYIFPAVTLLKPVKGADSYTLDNLETFVAQDYHGPLQVIFGLASGDDPARPMIESIIKSYPGRDIRLVISPVVHGPNLKVSNLINMYADAGHDIIIIADSDMKAGPGYISAVAEEFVDPSVGLVTCPYRGSYPQSIGAGFEALTINADFLPSVAVAERLEGVSFALGATMAVRREALEKIGGLKVLADLLADDYQLGNRVFRAGYRLVLSRYVLDSVLGNEGFAGYFSHQLRWARTYRVCRPAGYFMSVLTNGTAFSLMFLAASGFSDIGWAVACANLALRYAQAVALEMKYTNGVRVLKYYWLLPVRDVLSFVIWALSFTGNTVVWGGTKYKIDREGRMIVK